MTVSALIAIADGSEEMEAIIVADVLRRAEINVTLASVNSSSRTIKASRGVTIVGDATLAEVAENQFDLVVLPGGMPGATNLAASKELAELLRRQALRRGWIAAICAAPAVVLQPLGLLRDEDRHIMATCHPSFHSVLATEHQLSTDRVVVDGNLVTSQAPGTAFEFALTLIELTCGKATRDRIAEPLVL